MAQKVRIILEDDLDGGPADETVRFGLDGGQYEIDLSNANACVMLSARSRRRLAAYRTLRGPAVQVVARVAQQLL